MKTGTLLEKWHEKRDCKRREVVSVREQPTIPLGVKTALKAII